MTADDPAGQAQPRGLRARLSTQAEDTIGRIADDLLENALVNSALQRAATAREKMAQAQESAMDVLNLPSAANVEKLARRLRSISQRLDEIEDGVERVDNRLDTVSQSARQPELSGRLERIESRLDDIVRDVAVLRREMAPGEPIPAGQTRATVPEG